METASGDLGAILDAEDQKFFRQGDAWTEGRRDMGLDVFVLCGYIKRMRRQLLWIAQSEGLEICQVCAGVTRGRPYIGEDIRRMKPDYTRRECHECYTIRPEPPEKKR